MYRFYLSTNRSELFLSKANLLDGTDDGKFGGELIWVVKVGIAVFPGDAVPSG